MAYQKTAETEYDLDWADLVTLDLSTIDQPGGLAALSKQLEYAVQHVGIKTRSLNLVNTALNQRQGFFYVKNFGISDEEVDRQFELARLFFDLPLDEKLKYYDPQLYATGKNIGYRPITFREPVNGVKENTQIYSMPKFDGHHAWANPAVLQDHVDEIEGFQRKCHEKVLHRLLRIFEVILDVPGATLTKIHEYDIRGEDQLRYMHYASRTPEENEKLGNVYAGGHTDLGSLTLLFRQPVAALQIRNDQGEWKWVKPQAGTLTVNICDALSTISCGYLKSSIHRVHAPPPDQAHLDRVGVLYFGRINNEVYLDPLKNSGLLQKLGITENVLSSSGRRMTMEEWAAARGSQHSRRGKPIKAGKDGYEYRAGDLQFGAGLSVGAYN